MNSISLAKKTEHRSLNFSLVLTCHLILLLWQNSSSFWSRRTPDLTHLDIFLWEHVKSLVDETPVETDQELISRLTAAFQVIQSDDESFKQARRNHLRRLNRPEQIRGQSF